MPPDGSTSSRTAVAAVWLIFGRFLARSFDVVSLLVLGRLLGPGEFGVVATAMTLIYVVEAICELPVAQALVRAPILDRKLLDTAFTLGLIRGIFLAGTISLLSIPFSAFANDPHLIMLICVLGLAPAVRGLVSPGLVIFVRAIDFRREFVLDVTARAGAFLTATIVALETHSYWALAVGTVTAPLLTTILSYVLAPHRPRLSLAGLDVFLQLLGWTTVSQIFAAIGWQIDRLLLGGYVPRVDFGRFSVASDIAGIPYQALVYPLIRPLIAGLSTLGGDRQRLNVAYRKCCAATAMVGTPILVGIAVLSDHIVHVALGPQWQDAGPLLACLAISGVTPLLVVPFGSLAITLNRTQYIALSSFVMFCIKSTLIILSFFLYGIYGIAGARILVDILTSVYTMTLVRRLIGLSVALQLRAGARPFLSAAVMAACLLPITYNITTTSVSVGAVLILGSIVVLGALIYVGCLFLFWHLSGRPSGAEEIAASLLLRARLPLPWRRRKLGLSDSP